MNEDGCMDTALLYFCPEKLAKVLANFSSLSTHDSYTRTILSLRFACSPPQRSDLISFFRICFGVCAFSTKRHLLIKVFLDLQPQRLPAIMVHWLGFSPISRSVANSHLFPPPHFHSALVQIKTSSSEFRSLIKQSSKQVGLQFTNTSWSKTCSI